VYCNRSCLWVCLCVCVCVCVCLWVCYHDNSEVACIDPHQTGFVGKGSDHLQMIKFGPSRAPGKGVCGGAKIFGSALLQPARSVCVSLSTFSLYLFLFIYLYNCLKGRRLPCRLGLSYSSCHVPQLHELIFGSFCLILPYTAASTCDDGL